MQYRFLKDYEGFSKGDVAEIEKDTADILVKTGTIEVYDAEAEKAQKQSTEAIKKAVGLAVKEQIEELQKTLDVDGPSVKIHCEITKDEAEEGFRNDGEFLAAVKYASCTENSSENWDPRLKAVMAQEKAATGQNVTIGSEGGFFVGVDRSNELMKRAFGETVLARDAQKVPISAASDTLKWLDRTDYDQRDGQGQISVYRRSEAEQFTASKGKVEERSISLEKLTGLYYVTGEITKDAPACTTMMNDWFAEKFSEKIETEVYRGNGVKMMQGILNSPALVTQAEESGQTAATINAQNIAKMYSRVVRPDRAAWYVNQSALPELMFLTLKVGSTERPLWTPPSTGFQDAPGGMLLGRPIRFSEQCSALGTVGDIMIADMSQFLIIEKGGMEMNSSIHLRFDYDEEAFRFIVRNNGQSKWARPLTPKNDSTKTRSPFVVLATR